MAVLAGCVVSIFKQCNIHVCVYMYTLFSNRFGVPVLAPEERCFVTFPSDTLTVPLPNNSYQIYYTPDNNDTRKHVCLYIVCVCACTHVHVRVCVCECMHACVCACVHVCVHIVTHCNSFAKAFKALQGQYMPHCPAAFIVCTTTNYAENHLFPFLTVRALRVRQENRN